VCGIWYLAGDRFASSSATFGLFGHGAKMFIGVPALALNLAVVFAATLVLRALQRHRQLVPAPGPAIGR
jgi:hypothetical protein